MRQEDKEPVFDSVKTIVGMLEVSAEFAHNITFNKERIYRALPAGHLDATTLADYLVKKVSLERCLPTFSFFFPSSNSNNLVIYSAQIVIWCH